MPINRLTDNPKFQQKTPEEQETILRNYRAEQMSKLTNNPKFQQKTPEEQETILRNFKTRELGIDVEAQEQIIGTPATSRSRRGPRNPDSQPGVDWSAAGRGFAQGATLGFADEIAGGVESLVTDKPYEQARDESREAFREAEERAPGSYLAGEIGSVIVPGTGAAKVVGAGARGAVKAGRMGEATLRGAGAGALSGTGMGATAGAGYSEGDVGSQEFIEDTGMGAGAGLVLGGGTGGFSGLLGAGIRKSSKKKQAKRDQADIDSAVSFTERQGLQKSIDNADLTDQQKSIYKRYARMLDDADGEEVGEVRQQIERSFDSGNTIEGIRRLDEFSEKILSDTGFTPKQLQQLNQMQKSSILKSLDKVAGVVAAPIGQVWRFTGGPVVKGAKWSADQAMTRLKSLDDFVTNTSDRKLKAIGEKLSANSGIMEQLQNRAKKLGIELGSLPADPASYAVIHYTSLSDPEYRKAIRDILPEDQSLLGNARNTNSEDSAENQSGMLDRVRSRSADRR